MKVKNFWIRPIELSINAKEFTFGYTDKKEKRYKVEVKDNDIQSFHDFVFKIMAAMKKKEIPWPFVTKVKDKVKITNLDDKAEQMEMPLRVARRFAKYIREEGKGKPGEKGYRPTLWYWITPKGKKKLVDQKTVVG